MATVTLTATPVTGWKARLSISVSGATPGSTMTVERIVGSAVHPVLGGTAIPAAPVTMDDALPELEMDVSWRVRLSTGEVATAGPLLFRVPGRMSVLSDPYRASWVTVNCESWSERSAANRGAEVEIEGDAEPWVLGEPDEAERSELVLTAFTREAHEQLKPLAGSGRPFYLRTPWESGWLRSVDGRRTSILSVAQGVIRSEYRTLHIRSPHPDLRATGNTQGDLEAVFATQGELEDHPTIKTQADLETVDLKAMA